MSAYKPYPAYKDSGVEWFGHVPQHWSISQMKSGIQSIQNGVWGEDPNGGEDDIPCARVADFDRVRLVVEEPLPTLRSIPSIQRTYKRVRQGDLLLEKSGGGEQTTVGAMVQYLGEMDVVCSNFVAVLKCKEDVLPRWLCYVNSHLYNVGVNTRSIKQTTGIQNLDSNQYSAETIAFPPIAEQQVIAAHLDRETTRIDALITKKTRFIELLREKRQALITHAVTQGLDPNVKMKDSGVEWLGEVPEGWAVTHIKRLVTSISQGWSPECEPRPPEGDEWGVLKVGCVNGGKFRAEESKLLPSTLEPRPDLVVRQGDVLVSRANTRELVGSCAVVPKDFPRLMLCDKLYRLTAVLDKVLPEFLATLITVHGRRIVEVEATGASYSMVNIAQSVIMDLTVALPDVNGQKMLFSHLQNATAKLDLLSKKSERSIELLKERRSALITAAVTGQIDLREAA